MNERKLTKKVFDYIAELKATKKWVERKIGVSDRHNGEFGIKVDKFKIDKRIK